MHSALFHGLTKEEKIANAEKAVEESLKRRKIRNENYAGCVCQKT